MFDTIKRWLGIAPPPEVLGPPEPAPAVFDGEKQRAWHVAEAARFRALQNSPDFDAESMKQKFAAQAEVHEEAIRLLDQHISGS